jgi:hypothetical protein
VDVESGKASYYYCFYKEKSPDDLEAESHQNCDATDFDDEYKVLQRNGAEFTAILERKENENKNSTFADAEYDAEATTLRGSAYRR